MSFSNINCAEEHNTRTESYDIESGWTASVTVRTGYSLRYTLLEDIVTNGRLYPGLGISLKSASIKGDGSCAGGSDQEISYADALITLNYGPGNDKDLISESIEPTTEFITLDYKRFRWGAANGDELLEAEAPGKQLRSLNLVRTHMGLSALPGAILTEIGKVNGSTYSSTLLGLSFSEETLLLMPSSSQRTLRIQGTDGYTLVMKFGYKPQGWNKFWRAKTKSWEEIWDVESAEVYKNYPLGDFSGLLA